MSSEPIRIRPSLFVSVAIVSPLMSRTTELRALANCARSSSWGRSLATAIMIPKIHEINARIASPKTTSAIRSFLSFGRRPWVGPEPFSARPMDGSRNRRPCRLILRAMRSRLLRDHCQGALGGRRARRISIRRSTITEGKGGESGPAERARQSSIGPVTDSPIAGDAAALLEGAVEALPEGRLAEQMAGTRPLRVKLGIDPTAPDIHLGHVVVLTKLRQFQQQGHKVVLIIGDYTARVGDPSGRDTQRPILMPDQIEANAKTFQ